jgi:glutaconate CoA-transferase subunit B
VEVDAHGNTNMSLSGSLQAVRTKFPGVAGAASLRRWVKRPVLVVPRQSKRNLVPRVQVASTGDARPVRLITDLALFELGPQGARLISRHPGVEAGELLDRTGFPFATGAAAEALTPQPNAAALAAIRRLDPHRQRESLVG